LPKILEALTVWALQRFLPLFRNKSNGYVQKVVCDPLLGGAGVGKAGAMKNLVIEADCDPLLGGAGVGKAGAMKNLVIEADCDPLLGGAGVGKAGQ